MQIVRTTKRMATAIKHAEKNLKWPYSIWLIKTLGNRVDGSLSTNIVMDSHYELFEGDVQYYTLPLRYNQTATRVSDTVIYRKRYQS